MIYKHIVPTGLRILLNSVCFLKLTALVIAERSTIKDECATAMVFGIAKLTPIVGSENRAYMPGAITFYLILSLHIYS